MPYPNPNFQQPIYQQPMYPQQMYNQPQVQQVPQASQMQSGGFMSVRTEQEARNYPVAPGNVMTFKIENQPYVCEKAQGFSQLEGPIFNKYRLVKEEDVIETPVPTEQIDNITELRDEIERLRKDVEVLKDKMYNRQKTYSKKLVKEESENE